jgi:hypothetical protein
MPGCSSHRRVSMILDSSSSPSCVGRRMRKSHDWEGLSQRPSDMLGSKLILEYRFGMWASVLLVSIYQFASLWGGKRLWMTHDLKGLNSGLGFPWHKTHAARRQDLGAQYCESHRLSALFLPQPLDDSPCQGAWDFWPSSPFFVGVPPLFALLWKTTSESLPLHDNLCGCLPPRHSGSMSQESMSYVCFLFSSSQNISVSNYTHD